MSERLVFTLSILVLFVFIVLASNWYTSLMVVAFGVMCTSFGMTAIKRGWS